MVDSMNLRRIEYSVLGSVLCEPGHAGEVVALLSPENFSTEGTRGLFQAISALHFAGSPIDPVTALQKAGNDYESVVREVVQYAAPADSLTYYCEMLRDSARLRKVQGEAMVIASAETLDQAQEAIDRMNGLMVSQKRVIVLDAAQAASDFCDRTASQERPEYLTWGMAELDKRLYAELGDFIVIGGYASSGKTLLSLQFALELAQKYRVGYFSLETGPTKLTDRIMSHLAQVPLTKIKERDLNDADWAALATAGRQLASRHLDWINASGMTVRDIQALALHKRYQVIFVDYLQQIPVHGNGRYEKVTNISQGLHALAQSNGVAVIALAQLSRPEKSNGKPQPPTMSSFRESGQIEQDADIAILLWPSDPNDNQSRRVLKIAKNKEGERVRFELEFDGARQTMTPAQPTLGEKYRALHKAIREAAKTAPEQVTFAEVQGDQSDLPF